MINYFKKVFFLTQNLRKNLIFIFILISIMSLFDLFGIYLFIPLISKLLNNDKLFNNFYLEDILKNIDQNTLILVIFLIFFFKSLFHILFIVIKSNLIKNLTNFLSKNLLRRYLIKKYEFFFNISSSILIRNINSEIPAFANRTILVLLNMINDLLLLLFLISFLIFFSFETTLVFLIFFIIGVSIFLYLSKEFSYKWGLVRLKSEKEKLKSIDQIFHGIREIKIFNLQKLFFNKFKVSNNSNLIVQAKDNILQQVPRVILEIFFITLLLLFLTYLLQVKTKSEVILIIGVYTIAFSRILPAFSRVVMSVNSLRFTISTTDLLYQEFTKKDVNFDLNFKNNETAFKDYIELNKISFSYNNSKKKVLKDINLLLKKNNIYGISGQSGSGKSTILDIIMGLLLPTHGKIIIDEKKDLKNYFLSNAAYVSQNTFLLDGTILENIVLENTSAIEYDKAKIFSILKKVNLDKFVDNLEQGINTVIGENGISLSGGERQRLSLARALFQSPKILLLDEFTSALDSQNELAILENIKNLKEDMTIVIVSHNKKVLNICDKKYQLRDGSINEIN
jgi:ABC-type multidrug transport system fused ATPase/permease subunit